MWLLTHTNILFLPVNVLTLINAVFLFLFFFCFFNRKQMKSNLEVMNEKSCYIIQWCSTLVSWRQTVTEEMDAQRQIEVMLVELKEDHYWWWGIQTKKTSPHCFSSAARWLAFDKNFVCPQFALTRYDKESICFTSAVATLLPFLFLYEYMHRFAFGVEVLHP